MCFPCFFNFWNKKTVNVFISVHTFVLLLHKTVAVWHTALPSVCWRRKRRHLYDSVTAEWEFQVVAGHRGQQISSRFFIYFNGAIAVINFFCTNVYFALNQPHAH